MDIMEKIKRKEEIKKEIEEIKARLNYFTKDFINDYDLLKIDYIEDAMQEYADSNVNIYYSDIWEYYAEHKEESNEAIRELYTDFSNFNSLDDIIETASQLAQYNELYRELLEDLEKVEEIKELLEELEEIEADDVED